MPTIAAGTTITQRLVYFDTYVTLVNDGVINVTNPGLDAVYLDRSTGRITNAATASIHGANYGIHIFAERGSYFVPTVVNAGTVSGAATGIYLEYFGTIAGGTILNSGTIAGGTGAGVSLVGGGFLSNDGPGGSIHGGAGGVSVIFGAGTISNQAAISGATYGVSLGGGGTVTNQGTISGGTYGVVLRDGGTVSTAGTISGAGGTAVHFFNGYISRVVIDPGAVFVGTVDPGGGTLEFASAATAGTVAGLGTSFVNFSQLTVDSGASWTLTGANTIAAGETLTGTLSLAAATLNNSGTINGVLLGIGSVTNAGSIHAVAGAAINLTSGSVTNVAGGAITGASEAIAFSGAGTIGNAGTLASTRYSGIELDGGGNLTNSGRLLGATSGVYLLDGGTISNGGTLSGNDWGVLAKNAAATISNTGSMGAGTYEAVELDTGGFVSNSGTMTGITAGVYLRDGGTVANTGLLSSNGFGVQAKHAAATVINAGTIAGTNGTAVALASGYANRAVIDPGAVFSGTVDAGGGIIELASGSGTGTLTGLGTQFVDFAFVTIDAGATWSLPGTLAATLLNTGTLLGTVGALLTGSVTNNASGFISGTNEGLRFVTAAGTLNNAGTVTSSKYAAVELDAGGTVTNSGSVIGNSSAIYVLAGGAVTNTGTLTGGAFGVLVHGSAVSVSNMDSISGGSADGIYLAAGGTVGNAATGSIAGNSYGVLITHGAGTVINAGRIAGSGNSSHAVMLSGGFANRVVIDPGAAFIGTVDGGGGILELASSGSIGTLSGLGTQFVDFSQVYVDAGAQWTLLGGNSISTSDTLDNLGTLTGTLTLGNARLLNTGSFTGEVLGTGTVENAGTLIAGTGNGVSLTASAGNRVIFEPGAVFSGGVYGGGGTLELRSGSGTVGTQFSGFASLLVDGGVWNVASLTGVNSASVAGTLTVSSYLSGSVTLANAALINNGTLSGAVLGTGTLQNAGTLIGASGTAVSLTAAAGDRVVVDPGASFSGTVSGGGGVLELAAGSGTLPGFGTQFINFTATTIDNGATWALPGTISSGSTVVVAGTLTGGVTFAPGAADRLVLEPGGTFAGTADLGGGVLELASGAAVGTFAGVGTQVVNDSQIYVDPGARWSLSGTGSGSLLNAGTLRNGSGAAVQFAGGTVSNATAGFMSGSVQGILIASAAGSVGNAGTVMGGKYGVALAAGGVVNNAGSISGSLSAAIYLSTTGTVSNSGTLTGRFGLMAGALAADSFSYVPSTVVNSGRVSASAGGIYLFGGGVVSNVGAGYILGHIQGIYSDYGGTVSNTGTASTIAGASGVRIAGQAGEVDNAGVIASARGQAIYLGAGGAVTNSGTLSSTGSDAVRVDGGSATVSNSGSISADVFGVRLAPTQSATLGNTGSIFGGLGGVVNYDGNVTNSVGGQISGTPFAVRILGVGTIFNAGTLSSTADAATQLETGGLVSNSGRIIGGSGGVYLTAGGTVSNTGTISGQFGIAAINAAATVTNAGTLIGSAGTAVSLANGFANRVVVDPGAVFSGNVLGGGGTLELASSSTAGTLSGLGLQYSQFSQIAIDAGSNWTLRNANSIASGATLTNTGALLLNNASLTDTGALINNGQIVIDPSSMTVASLGGIGTVTIGTSSTLDVTGSISSGQTIVFADATGVLQLGDPIDAAGTIAGFVNGDTIDLTSVAHQNTDTAALLPGNTLEIVTGNGTFDLRLSPTDDFTGDFFHLGSDGASGSNVTENEVPCFLHGTLIRTDRGEVAVESLRIGDHVVTHTGRNAPITWIGIGRAFVTPARRSAATPVIVHKGALADNVPHHDLRLTKGHALFIDDVLVPVEFLVNHRSIIWDDHAHEVAFFHIELGTHDVLLANGAPTESYRDDGNRWLFRNANSGWDQPPKPACAPVLTGGKIVDTIWRRLLDRAGPRPGMPLTDDPDLHLLVDGARVDANARHGDAYLFALTAPPGSVRVVSRSAVPAELGVARDARELGVALHRIVLIQRARVVAIEAADPMFTDGFHSFEADDAIRWTDGDALLPRELFRGHDGKLTLELHLRGATRYPLQDWPRTRAA